jgi:hypothetical protein
MSWVSVGVAVGGAVLSSQNTDKSWKTEARNAGKNRAQIEASRSRTQGLLEGKTRAVEEGALVAKVQAESDAVAAESQAVVNAAAAGASGANVDQSVQGVQSNAARAKAAIEKQRRAGLLQVKQDYEEIFWNAENKKYSVSGRTGGDGNRNAAAAALAGFEAYVQNR